MSGEYGGLVERVFQDTPPQVDATADRFLDAAQAEFVQVGIRRARLGDIARRAGVTRVTVHRKYATKNDLIAAVLAREGRRAMAEIDQALNAIPAIADKIAYVFAYCVCYPRHGELGVLLINDPQPVLPALTVHGEPLIAIVRTLLTHLLRHAQTSGELTDFDPEPAADVLAHLTFSYAMAAKTLIPMKDHTQATDFARAHITPLITRYTPPNDLPADVPSAE